MVAGKLERSCVCVSVGLVARAAARETGEGDALVFFSVVYSAIARARCNLLL